MTCFDHYPEDENSSTSVVSGLPSNGFSQYIERIFVDNHAFWKWMAK
jgi:hypothetical protein